MRHHVMTTLMVAAMVACGATRAAPLRTAGTSKAADRPHGTLRWIGGPSAIVDIKGLRVMTDPMLGPREERAFVLPKHPSSGVIDAPIARYTSPPAFDLSGLGAILVSHTHADHFDAQAKRDLPKDVPLVVAASGAEAMRAAGFTDVRPIDWGEHVLIQAGSTRLDVHAVPAHHAHDPDLDHTLGRGNGYVLEWRDSAGSYRVYWTGDAVLSEESTTFRAQLGQVDLLLPHMGGVGGDGGLGLRTMNAEEALELVRRIDPKLVVPIHHTTFAHYREPIEALMQRAAEGGEMHRFRFVREGETVALTDQ
jgi:N-acyl-phosphatidylethanolamine-hydrolysing phospholipase D